MLGAGSSDTGGSFRRDVLRTIRMRIYLGRFLVERLGGRGRRG